MIVVEGGSNLIGSISWRMQLRSVSITSHVRFDSLPKCRKWKSELASLFTNKGFLRSELEINKVRFVVMVSRDKTDTFLQASK